MKTKCVSCPAKRLCSLLDMVEEAENITAAAMTAEIQRLGDVTALEAGEITRRYSELFSDSVVLIIQEVVSEIIEISNGPTPEVLAEAMAMHPTHIPLIVDALSATASALIEAHEVVGSQRSKEKFS